MALMMDSLSGSAALKADGATAICFAQEGLSLHDLNAGTSGLLNGPDIQVFESEYEGQFLSPSTSAFSSYSHSPQSSSEDGSACHDVISCSDTFIAPGPTSCVFLEKELKRLYAKEDFDVLESLGEGFFGDVFKVKHRITGEVMVLKVGKDRERENRSRAKASVLKEVSVLNQLTEHPNLLAFRGVCVDIDPSGGLWNLHILVDYCDGGSLNRLICDTQRVFPWRLRCSLGRDIACAMLYVHSKNIMHRDLTSMNVLLQTAANGTKAVVADFGLSCRIPHVNECLVQVGTPYWMAPECLKEEFYDQNADVFSFGIIMCQMIARIDADPEAGMYRTNNFGLDYMRFLAHCPMDTPLELLKLAFQCVVMDPAKRPSFVRIHDRLNEFLSSYSRDPENSNTLRVDVAFADSKLGRSLSDAVLKSPPSFKPVPTKFFQVQKEKDDAKVSEGMSSLEARRPAILVEGIPLSGFENKGLVTEQTNKSRMEELARSVAVKEVELNEGSLESGNPFICHEVYSTTRKLALPDMVPDQRRGSSTSERQRDRGYTHTGATDPYVLVRTLFTNEFELSEINVVSDCEICFSDGDMDAVFTSDIFHKGDDSPRGRCRRSISMPCGLASTSRVISLDEDLVNPSFSSPYQTMSPLCPFVVDGIQCALQGRMTMNFKHEDQKFTSRRYPSRRHTVMDGNLVSKEGLPLESLQVLQSFTPEEFRRLPTDSNYAVQSTKPHGSSSPGK
ncbi:unnamed protein product [Enterobius vermicularis]|uniref:Protein kinase domain-containing protein n=1 Tax=Enterobius vermicularis TaxID=51028 RepID=A0A0N4V788_ENTVE|nr:unnamed protein product [Enterobius vermicularis]